MVYSGGVCADPRQLVNVSQNQQYGANDPDTYRPKTQQQANTTKWILALHQQVTMDFKEREWRMDEGRRH